MPEGPFSQQDLQDLDAIARQLPKGDPRAEKIRGAIRAQQAPGQTSVEKAAPPENYGFTPSNLLRSFGQGAKGLVGGIYEMGKDVVQNPNWFTGPDSTYEKFVGGPAASEAQKATDAFKSGKYSQAAGHELAGAIPLIGPWAAHLGERAGTGDVGGATGEAAGTMATGYALPRLRSFAREHVYADMPPSGKGPQLTPLAKQGARVAGGAAGWGLMPAGKYEGGIAGAMLGPDVLKKIVGEPELGSVKNPGEYSKIKNRIPASVLKEGATEGSAGNLKNLGEPTETSSRARMGPPLRPTIFTPESAQVYDAQMARLKPEAQAAGLYSAARGKVGRVPDYQERTGGEMIRPFGSPNASGESSASLEAQNRATNEGSQGVKYFRVDKRSNTRIPISNIDGPDAKAGPYEVIERSGPEGTIELDRGSKAAR